MLAQLLPMFIACLVLISFLVLAMSVGVIFGKEPIKGSCGGMKALNMNTACDICGDDPNKCTSDDFKNSEQFYSALESRANNNK